MTAPIGKRLNIQQILEDKINFPQLYERYLAHLKGDYKKTLEEISNFKVYWKCK